MIEVKNSIKVRSQYDNTKLNQLETMHNGIGVSRYDGPQYIDSPLEVHDIIALNNPTQAREGIHCISGNAMAPSICFSASPNLNTPWQNNGIYHNSALNGVGISINGTQKLLVENQKMTVAVPTESPEYRSSPSGFTFLSAPSTTGITYDIGTGQARLRNQDTTVADFTNTGLRFSTIGTRIRQLQFGAGIRGGAASYTINFSNTFSSTPTVCINVVVGKTSEFYTHQVTAISTISFTYRVVYFTYGTASAAIPSGEPHDIQWIAMCS